MASYNWPSNPKRNQASVEAIFEAAKAAYKMGRFAQTERLCNQILCLRPDHIWATSLLGLVAGQTGRLEMGIDLLRKVVIEEPGSWGSWNGLATMLRMTGRPGEAVNARQSALALKPDDPTSLGELGLCLLDICRFDEAADVFRKAMRLEPLEAVHQHNLATARYKSGSISEAVDGYRRAIELDPKSVHSYATLARLLFADSKPAEGYECARKAYEVDRNGVRGNLEMAHALMSTSRFEEAISFVDRAIEVDHTSAEARAMKATLLQQLGRFAEAEPLLHEAISFKPRWALPYSLIVKGRKFTEEDRPFIESLCCLVDEKEHTYQDLEDLCYAAGKALNDFGEYEQAIGYYDRANALAEARLKSSQTHFSRGIYIDSYDRIVSAFDSNYFEWNRSVGLQDSLPILIVGMIRSGTTLVEQIVSSHPEVGAGGELDFWSRRGVRFHQEARESANPEEIAEIGSAYLQVLRRLQPQAKHVTDKMPQNFMALGLIHTAFPNAKIIHCRRNPVDNCLSIYLTPYGQGSPDYAYNRDNIVFAYRQYLRLMEHWRAVLPPDRFLEVDYEDLVLDGESVTRRMIEFLGLEWDDACLHHDQNDRVVRTPSLWQARQPIYNTSVERWRNYEPWLGAFRELVQGDLH